MIVRPGSMRTRLAALKARRWARRIWRTTSLCAGSYRQMRSLSGPRSSALAGWSSGLMPQPLSSITLSRTLSQSIFSGCSGMILEGAQFFDQLGHVFEFVLPLLQPLFVHVSLATIVMMLGDIRRPVGMPAGGVSSGAFGGA